MTREEAIKIIEVVFKSKEAYKHNDSVTHQALNMAIEALSADTVSRETYHNLVTASNDIDRALREYQDKEENGEFVSVVRCKDCQYRKKVGTSYYCDLDEFNVKDADFCSWGEREGGTND